MVFFVFFRAKLIKIKNKKNKHHLLLELKNVSPLLQKIQRINLKILETK